MKQIQRSLLIMVLLMIPMLVSASFTPTLGFYGISYRKTVEDYQNEFLGKSVKYLPTNKTTPSEYDIKYFVDKGGNFESEYIISKITGNNKKKIVFHLQDKTTNEIVKFEFYNTYSFDNFYLTAASEIATLPLLLIEEFNKDVEEFVGKSIGEDLVISKYDFMEFDNGLYPGYSLTVTDNSTGESYYTIPQSREDLKLLGTVYTNPKFKCVYTLVKIEHDYITTGITDIKYTVLNSINKKTKEVEASKAETEAFKGDGDSRFYASLQKVEKPTNSEVRYGETKEITDKDITKFSYVDNFIDIIIVAGHSQFDFIIKNVSESTIKVVWNEAVFVDVDGSTSKIMHTGIKYSNKEGDQPASTIIKGAKLEDIAVPTKNVYYSNVLKDWNTYSLYVSADKDATDQTIKLMLPIQVKDVINEYIFEFGLTHKLKYPELVVEE